MTEEQAAAYRDSIDRSAESEARAIGRAFHALGRRSHHIAGCRQGPGGARVIDRRNEMQHEKGKENV